VFAIWYFVIPGILLKTARLARIRFKTIFERNGVRIIQHVSYLFVYFFNYFVVLPPYDDMYVKMMGLKYIRKVGMGQETYLIGGSSKKKSIIAG
jgi:hypothetical protein